jgi:hypothetical protein
VSSVHGSSVYVNPYETMRDRLDESDLLLVSDGARDIAGMYITYEQGRPHLWSTGVRDGDRKYLKMGALAAVYHFSFEYLSERGFENVDMGRSRAFLNDGILRYKPKWAQAISASIPARIALKIVDGTPGSKSFLQDNPFIFEKSGDLYGAVFLSDEESQSSDTAARLKKDYFHEGMSKLILCCPTGPQGPIELPDNVEILSSEESRRFAA